MESYKKKILKFTIIGMIFVVVMLTTKELYAANKKQLQAGRISIPKTSYTYTGKEIKPKPTVKHKGLLFTTTLKEGTDYTVSYRYNTKVTSEHYNNSAEVVIKGKGDYTGIVTKYFTIKPIDIKYCTISLSSNTYIYNSKPKKPKVTLYKNGNLIRSSNYSVEYDNNTAAGIALVTVTGFGNYTGIKQKTFIIEKRHISTANVTLSKDIYEFDGTERKPSIKSIKIWTGSEYKTVSSKYYTVKYKNNKNPGTASVIIKGTGNFTGTKTINFTINKGDIYNTKVNLSKQTFTYDSTQKKLKVKSVQLRNSKGELVTVPEKYYEVSYKNHVSAGTATVIIKGEGKFTGTKKVEYTIKKRNIKNASVTLKQRTFTYDGAAKKPSIDSIKIITPDGEKTVKSTCYEVIEYGNNTNAGTAYVKIKGKENFTGEKKVTFKIKPKEIEDVIITNKSQQWYLIGNNPIEEVSDKIYYFNERYECNDYEKKLIEGVDYIYKEDFLRYSLDDKGYLLTEFSARIEGIGNYKGTKVLSYDTPKFKLIDIDNSNMISSPGKPGSVNSYNYDYINKQLNGILDSYRVDINNLRISIYPTAEYSPVDIYYLNPYNNHESGLLEGYHYIYTKKGNKYIITGINQFKGTRTITVK